MSGILSRCPISLALEKDPWDNRGLSQIQGRERVPCMDIPNFTRWVGRTTDQVGDFFNFSQSLVRARGKTWISSGEGVEMSKQLDERQKMHPAILGLGMPDAKHQSPWRVAALDHQLFLLVRTQLLGPQVRSGLSGRPELERCCAVRLYVLEEVEGGLGPKGTAFE